MLSQKERSATLHVYGVISFRVPFAETSLMKRVHLSFMLNKENDKKKEKKRCLFKISNLYL